jgi:hypothetical protein
MAKMDFTKDGLQVQAQFAVFANETPQTLQKVLNEWSEENNNLWIVDVKFSSSEKYFEAMIVYYK